ncbi:MAG TPA: hypothetical protein VGN34_20125, partial [Ktedonobacteraceae bacterium]
MQQESNVMSFRLITLEQQLQQVQEQLKSYVPQRENELQLQGIQQTVSRIERDAVEVKIRLERQKKETRSHEEIQRTSQAALQIRVLW